MDLHDQDNLGVYLNDHLAGSVGGINLARRIRDANRGSELGELLAELTAEIEEDRDSLRSIMRRLDCAESRIKQMAGAIAEKLGRMKPNGAPFSGYSDLSRMLELEELFLGVSGKASLWKNLKRARGDSLAGFDLDRLIRRAEDQRERLERARLDLAADALAKGGGGSS